MERTLGVPLRQWSENGFLQLSEGKSIDYRDVRLRLDWARKMFDLREVCWDPWNSAQISIPMIDDGFQCVEIPQRYSTLSEPTKKILQLVAQGQLHHGNHPVLRWHAGCVTAKPDGRDNLMFVKPDRIQTANRIDGMAALANAMARAMVEAPTREFEFTLL